MSEYKYTYKKRKYSETQDSKIDKIYGTYHVALQLDR
jgi:hypothetical protein